MHLATIVKGARDEPAAHNKRRTFNALRLSCSWRAWLTRHCASRSPRTLLAGSTSRTRSCSQASMRSGSSATIPHCVPRSTGARSVTSPSRRSPRAAICACWPTWPPPRCVLMDCKAFCELFRSRSAGSTERWDARVSARRRGRGAAQERFELFRGPHGGHRPAAPRADRRAPSARLPSACVTSSSPTVSSAQARVTRRCRARRRSKPLWRPRPWRSWRLWPKSSPLRRRGAEEHRRGHAGARRLPVGARFRAVAAPVGPNPRVPDRAPGDADPAPQPRRPQARIQLGGPAEAAAPPPSRSAKSLPARTRFAP